MHSRIQTHPRTCPSSCLASSCSCCCCRCCWQGAVVPAASTAGPPPPTLPLPLLSCPRMRNECRAPVVGPAAALGARQGRGQASAAAAVVDIAAPAPVVVFRARRLDRLMRSVCSAAGAGRCRMLLFHHHRQPDRHQSHEFNEPFFGNNVQRLDSSVVASLHLEARET